MREQSASGGLLASPDGLLMQGSATRLNRHCRSPSSRLSLFLVAQSRIAAISRAVGFRVCATLRAAAKLSASGKAHIKTALNAVLSRDLIRRSPSLRLCIPKVLSVLIEAKPGSRFLI